MTFWNLTLPELFALFDAHAMKMRRRYEVATLTAWQSANLMRADPKKRLPKLAKLLQQFETQDSNGRQTPKQMLSVLHQLAEKTGFPMSTAAAHG